jgi:hypothetical protein
MKVERSVVLGYEGVKMRDYVWRREKGYGLKSKDALGEECMWY